MSSSGSSSGSSDHAACRVVCYSGQTYAERPVSFNWQGQRLVIEDIVRQWRDPEGPAFEVETARGVFLLSYDEAVDAWRIAAKAAG